MEADGSRWQRTAERYRGGRYMDSALAAHIRDVNLELIRKWAPLFARPRVLMTDAFADATWPERAFSWHIHHDAQPVCIDISSVLSLKARENAVALGHCNTSYATADVRSIPFADDSFDLIVSDSTLDHFHTKDEICIAIRELSRVLRPGGVLILSLDNPENLSNPLFQLWLRSGRQPYFIGKSLSRGELTKALSNAGLNVTETTAVFHYPRFLTKVGLRVMRRITPGRCDEWARQALSAANRLECLKTRYLTGLFVAARAVKPVH